MRSSWKFVYSNTLIDRKELSLKKLALKRKKNYKRAKLHIVSRGSTILPLFFGQRVLVHQGKQFIEFLVKDYMAGHKFGEYSFCKNIGALIHEPKKKGKSKGNTALKRR